MKKGDIPCSAVRHSQIKNPKVIPKVSGNFRPMTLRCCTSHGVGAKATGTDAPQLSRVVSEVETLMTTTAELMLAGLAMPQPTRAPEAGREKKHHVVFSLDGERAIRHIKRCSA